MKKFLQVVQRNLAETRYRLLSLTNLSVNKIAKPVASKVSKNMNKIFQEDEGAPVQESSPVKKYLKEGFFAGNNFALKTLNNFGEYIDQSTVDIEKRLREEYGVQTNQWIFSMENLVVLEKISVLVGETFKEVENIHRLDAMKYLNAWRILQDLHYREYERSVFSHWAQLSFAADQKKIFEFKHIQEECLYFSIFANGTYGKLLNAAYREKRNIQKLMKITSYTEDFIAHTKIDEGDVLHSFWDSTPYKPAYVIIKDPLLKTIILCMRGTHHWADAITDLDFHYLRFSVLKDLETSELFIRFDFKGEEQEVFKQKLGKDTRYLNTKKGEVKSEDENENKDVDGAEEVLVTGYTHAGMFVSAVEAYKLIAPKMEEIFAKEEFTNFNLAITGHSLGGGMATLMALLLKVHPLKALEDERDQRLNGYSYGGASVLSKEFEEFMKPVMKSVVFGDDIVPRLSFGSIKDICNIMAAFDEMNKNEPGKLKEILSLENQLDTSQADGINSGTFDYKELYESFKRDHINSTKLYPSGRVFYLQDVRHTSHPRDRDGDTDSDFDFVMKEVHDKHFFDELRFSKQIIRHHFPYFYEESLSSSKVLYQNFYPINGVKNSDSLT